MNLPKRDELGLLTVVALPNASNTGFDAITSSESFCETPPPAAAERHTRYLMMYLIASVLPAPEMPDTTIDWSRPPPSSVSYALSAVWKRWGSGSFVWWRSSSERAIAASS